MTATIRTEATIARARQLLHTAADASRHLEETIRDLVTMRAWDVLGYENFSGMWEAENGFSCPSFVKVLAADGLMDEGMNTAPSRVPKNGHLITDVARAIGYSVHQQGAREQSSPVTALKSQKDAGVPVEHRAANSRKTSGIVERFGRRRPQPRRMGKGPDEFVDEGLYLPRRDADAIADIAREADVPKAEIYRQAVAEYLMRHRESRPGVAS